MIIQATPAQSQTTPALKPRAAGFSMVSGQNDRMAGSVPVWGVGHSFRENLAAASTESSGNAFGAKSSQEKSTEESSFGLLDLIDIINPLQHIPIVSQLYQSATGDTMGSVAQIVGGALFGGPVGGAVSAAMVAYQYAKTSPDTIPYIDGAPVDAANQRTEGFRPFNT